MYCQHDNYPSTCRICANARNASIYCRICQRMTDHHEYNCPYQVHAAIASVNRTRACRALGCTDCKRGQTHHCSVCGDRDSTHRSRNCPLLASQCMNVSHNVNPTPQIAYVSNQPSRIAYVSNQQPAIIAIPSGNHARYQPSMIAIPSGNHVQSQPIIVFQNGRMMMYRN